VRRPLGDDFTPFVRWPACLPARHAKSSVRPATIGGVWRFLRPGRTRRDPGAAAADEFWRRWARLRPAVAAALDSGELQAVEPQVAAAVAGLHRRLGWSLSGRGGDPGDRYVLVVTGEGDQRLRALTDAWLAAAPTDAGWDYHDAAQALEDPSEVTVGIGELQVPLADVRIRALDDGEVLHVTVFHPALAQLSGQDREAFSLVALDTALGERLVEGRIGCVEPVDTDPAGSIDLMALRGLVSGIGTAPETATDMPRPVCPTG
jgi:hypothetical protein